MAEEENEKMKTDAETNLEPGTSNTCRRRLHRVTFYDLLHRPKEQTEDDVQVAHLSVPFYPGVETVWAPNGYGKTYGFKLLEMLRFPNRTSKKGKFWLGEFLEQALSSVKEPQDPDYNPVADYRAMNPVAAESQEFWQSSHEDEMYPFSAMLARFLCFNDAGDKITEVQDLIIRPEWSEGAVNVFHVSHHDAPDSLRFDKDLHFSHDSELRALLDGDESADSYPYFAPYFPSVEEEDFEVVPPEDPGVSDLRYVRNVYINDPSNYDWLDWADDDGLILDCLDDLFSAKITYVEIPSVCNSSPNLSQCQSLVRDLLDHCHSLNDAQWNQDYLKESPVLVLDELNRLAQRTKSFRIEAHEINYELPRLRGFLPGNTSSGWFQREGDYSWELFKLINDATSKVADNWDHHQGTWNWADTKAEILAKEPDAFVSGSRSLEKWTVAELKGTLKILGLPVSGKKSELVARLEEAAPLTTEEMLTELADFDPELAVEVLFKGRGSESPSGKTAKFLNMAPRFGPAAKALSRLVQMFAEINHVIAFDDRDPWSRYAILDLEDDEEPLKFEIRRGYRVPTDTLSFGQRSAIVLEVYLAYIEIFQMDPPWSAFCLVIDEPEAGRSESWVDLLVDRIGDSRTNLERDSFDIFSIDPAMRRSILVLSHRRDVLVGAGNGGVYHLMQPYDLVHHEEE